jgi:hypothetical protein
VLVAQGSAKKVNLAQGLLTHRHALSASAAAPNNSPHVQAAFKEIVASPSPKVSALVERFKHKEALIVEAAVVEKEREQKRAAMLAEAQKVRAARKKAVEDSEAKFNRAEQLRVEADSALAKQRERRRASGGGGTSAALGASEQEDQALVDAEKMHKQRIKEAELAKAAMTAARAEHDKAIRMEQAFLTIHARNDDEGPEREDAPCCSIAAAWPAGVIATKWPAGVVASGIGHRGCLVAVRSSGGGGTPRLVGQGGVRNGDGRGKEAGG